MLAYPVLRYKERLWLVLGTTALGLVFGFTFLTVANRLFFTVFGPLLWRYQPQWAAYAPFFAFPALSLLFYVSFRAKPLVFAWNWAPRPLLPTAFALSIAFVFGMCLGAPAAPVHWTQLLWVLWIVPVSEEWLFRGWLWNLLGRIVQNRFFSFTNPIPAVVVGTSFAFAFWHIQNGALYGPWLTAWQILYTFFASLWLGQVRSSRPGLQGMGAVMLCHIALNAATTFGRFLR